MGPNLFLLGAPKCATTSFYDLLARHPQVMCPKVKEPGFHTRESVRDEVRAVTPHLRDESAYVRLYSSAGPESRVFVDGSTSYLRSGEAVTHIARTYEDAHAVAVVRDPVDLVSSYFTFLSYKGWEDAPSLEVAWRRMAERREGRGISKVAKRPDALVYADVAALGTQILHARAEFGPRLHVAVMSDMVADPGALVRDLEDAFDLDHHDLGPLPRENSARASRFRWIDSLVQDPPPWVRRSRDLVKRRTGRASLGVKSRLDSWNSAPIQRSVDPGLQAEMRSFFWDEVVLMSTEMDRDFLSEWGWV